MKIRPFLFIAVVSMGCTNHKAIIVDEIRKKQNILLVADGELQIATMRYAHGFAANGDVSPDSSEIQHWTLVKVNAQIALDSLNLELKKY